MNTQTESSGVSNAPNRTFDQMNGTGLVATYNALVREAESVGLTGYREVNRFADRESAVRRCEGLASSLRARAGGLAAEGASYKELKVSGGLRSGPVPAPKNSLVSTPQPQLKTSLTQSQPASEQPPETQVADAAEEADMARKKNERTASKARGGGKRVEGRQTLAEQMEEYNAMVPKAQKKGVKCKVHTSTFESYDKGVKQIKRLREAIEAA